MGNGREVSGSAFIYRVKPGGVDKLEEALRTNHLITGWAKAEGLLNEDLNWVEFREIIRKAYYADDQTLRRAGTAAGNLWRFIREMRPGDLVVVPHGNNFFVAKITGDAIYDDTKVNEDSAYRRPVRWLNDKKPISRKLANADLLRRMKTWNTSARADDLLDKIHNSLNNARSGERPTFNSHLYTRLVEDTLDELHHGFIDDRGFEKLIESLLKKLGAVDTRIVPRRQDRGADILATFRVAGIIQQVVAIQAKHWKGDSPVTSAVVQQLINGIEAEGADLGMVITSGIISKEAEERAKRYFEETGVNIDLVDGEMFAKLLVESGMFNSTASA